MLNRNACRFVITDSLLGCKATQVRTFFTVVPTLQITEGGRYLIYWNGLLQRA